MKAHRDSDARHGIWRTLRLVGPGGEFLFRSGIDLGLIGIYLHRITDVDPGLDLHDHPWPFVSIVLSGGYTEKWAEIRTPDEIDTRSWLRGSVHRIRSTECHRICHVLPGTWTLVLRGRKSRLWGFYVPSTELAIADGGLVGMRDDGPALWVEQTAYDYEARRPAQEVWS